jgi:hypothetical protein
VITEQERRLIQKVLKMDQHESRVAGASTIPAEFAAFHTGMTITLQMGAASIVDSGSFVELTRKPEVRLLDQFFTSDSSSLNPI